MGFIIFQQCAFFMPFLVFLHGIQSDQTNFNEEKLTLTIEQGTLFGKKSLDYFNGSYYSFEGIPYAKPPIGDLRFKAPESPEPWTDVYDATQIRPICPQTKYEFITKELEQNENCLFVNVHTKMSKELRPVMVWIHGGAFAIGSIFESYYGPEILMTEDIVLVKVAYRLNIFGFLSIADSKYEIHGNAGFKDQVMALKWVQKNIQHFGGDPNQVTIFGESAGGASVHLLYLSPLSKGLFHRAIVESGAAIEPWLTSPYTTLELARALECKLEKLDETVNCLNSKTTDELSDAFIKMKNSKDYKEKTIGEIASFNTLTIEDNKNPNSFMTQNPSELIKNGDFHKVPIIMGFCTHEGEFVLPFGSVRPNFTDYTSLIPKDIEIDLKSEKAQQLGKKIKEFYYGDQIPSNDLIDPYIDYTTDIFFLEKIYKSAKLQSISAKDTPIYFYQFDYSTKLNSHKHAKKYITHMDDLNYLFYMKGKTLDNLDQNSDEYIGIHRMVKLWTTFASSKNADPNPDNDPLLNVKWLPIESNKFNYLKISPNLELKENPAENRMKFWEDIYKQYN